ncbi:hypothetical protein QEH56_13435 [Pelagicoccus enzymogenes]|uniref:hypothetical protein n=1 Tax=Pelagicoccus enzymogenes TaxID=2773457 RepID=UPI00280EC8DA|nr:hypothetical protein [Pelagicoccus enzymogenes]MDQ8199165.1 hypothetical protein [Pelagicoccus enzymogenes]
MILCYDLEVSPETFDVAGAIALAQAQAKSQSSELETIVLIPGKKAGFRSNDDTYPINEQRWRLTELVLPLISICAPNCSVLSFKSRNEAAAWLEQFSPKNQRYPIGYDIEKPHAQFCVSEFLDAVKAERTLPKWEADPQALTISKEWIQKNLPKAAKGIVSITLRQTHSFAPRNSNIEEWKSVTTWLQARGYGVIVVPDTETAVTAIDDWPNETLWQTPCYNLKIRQALYQSCTLNLFVNNGPAILCYQSNSPYLSFKLVTPGVNVSNIEYFAKEGFYPTQPWPQSSDKQKLVWEDDNFLTITSAIEEWEAGTPRNYDFWRAACLEASNAGEQQKLASYSAVAAAFCHDRSAALALRTGAVASLGRLSEAMLIVLAAIEENLDPTRFQQELSQWKTKIPAGSFELLERILSKQAALTKESGKLLSLRELVETLQNQKTYHSLYIYGTGVTGEKALKSLPNPNSAIGFSDSNPELHGKTRHGKPIVAPQTAVDDLDSQILIASMYGDEILESLLKRGVSIDRIAFADL